MIKVNEVTYKPGCYADGSLGHDHIRKTLAELVKGIDPVLASEIRGTPSDDFSEEDDAIELLNGVTKGGSWELYEGSLYLVKEEDYNDK